MMEVEVEFKRQSSHG